MKRLWQRDRLRLTTAMRPRLAALMLALFGAGAAVWAPAASAAPSNQDEVIVPKASAQPATAPGDGPGMGALTAVAVILLAGAGGWVLWRGKGAAFAPMRGAPRQLAIDETRSLGNRQYLVVASYQDRKYLLGVCPGRIDLLAPLNDATPPVERPRP